MVTKVNRSEQTRARIITVAQSFFARDGFAAASLAEIVQAADVTTGAVYHHFGDKKGLFTAVAESLEQVILDEISRLPRTGDLWTRFENGVLRTLEICARPDIQRIVFQEAPMVVGPSEWRAIEVKYSLGLMQASIRALNAAGAIQAPNADLTAQILLGAIIQAAHNIAISDGKPQALADAQSIIRRLIRSLKA
jgi:AcrR family transcriptional regulator